MWYSLFADEHQIYLSVHCDFFLSYFSPFTGGMVVCAAGTQWDVVQLVEHLLWEQAVGGSIPSIPVIALLWHSAKSHLKW